MTNSFYSDFDKATAENRRHADHRTPFQMDRDRVVFSYAFRRLQSKTQVFQSGEHDFYRTRLTHSIEVSRIGRSICDYLRAEGPLLGDGFHIDADLVEAICLAHDLGHPPFGHIGERKLNELMRDHGGFEGNAQTVRILTELFYERDDGPRGMDPSRAFLDGVLKYKDLHREAADKMTGGATYPANHFLYDEQEPVRAFACGADGKPGDAAFDNFLSRKSIECQIMDWSDDTAYCLHDIIDGSKAGFLSPLKLERWAEDAVLSAIQAKTLERVLTAMRRGRLEVEFSVKVGEFINACRLSEDAESACSPSNRYRYKLEVRPEIEEESRLYKRLAKDLIFDSPQIQQIEFKGGYVLERLFTAFAEHYAGDADRPLKILPEGVARAVAAQEKPRGKLRVIADHLAALTDGLARRTYNRLYNPDFTSFIDIG